MRTVGGTPKGARLTHANLYANAIQLCLWRPDMSGKQERSLAVLPLFHAFGMTAVMMHMNTLLAGIFLAVVPALFAVIHLLGRRISGLTREAKENESRFFSEAQRGVAAIPIVQAFTAEDLERERVMRATGDARAPRVAAGHGFR